MRGGGNVRSGNAPHTSIPSSGLQLLCTGDTWFGFQLTEIRDPQISSQHHPDPNTATTAEADAAAQDTGTGTMQAGEG